MNLGPLRINLSKRGVGMSVGAGPIRIGRSTTGRSYRSLRLPGTGISHRTSAGQSGGSRLGCCVPLAGLVAIAGSGIWCGMCAIGWAT